MSQVLMQRSEIWQYLKLESWEPCSTNIISRRPTDGCWSVGDAEPSPTDQKENTSHG